MHAWSGMGRGQDWGLQTARVPCHAGGVMLGAAAWVAMDRCYHISHNDEHNGNNPRMVRPEDFMDNLWARPGNPETPQTALSRTNHCMRFYAR